MPEKKEKKTEIKSESFREIVDGEFVGKAKEAKKPAGKSVKEPEKKEPVAEEKIEAVELLPVAPKEEKPEIESESLREIVDGEVVKKAKPVKPEKKKPKKKARHVEDQQPEKIRRSLRYSAMEGIFNSASGSIQSSYTTPLALALGATNGEIGILNSLQNLSGTVAHVPGAMLTKFFNRKSIWVFSQLFARIIIWVPVMFLQFLSIENRVWIFILLLVASNFFLYLRNPAWSSLMGDLVSLNIRGRYFGRRNMLVGIAGVFATLVAGFILAYYGFFWIFLISVILAVTAIFFFLRIHEPPLKRIFHYTYEFSFDPKGWYNTIVINKEFMLFTVYMTFINFAIDIAAPFYAVYMLKDLSIGYEWFAIAVVIGALARAMTQQYWGRLNDRFGSRKILIVCGVLSCFVPFGWMMVSNVWYVIIVKIYDGVVFSGFDLVAFNYLLEVAPTKSRPKYIAGHNFSIGFGTVFGNLLGGVLAQTLETYGFLWLFGLQIVFLVSFVLRLACSSLLLLIKTIDVKQSELVPVRYIFWQAVAVEPAKGVKHAIAYTFRYPYHVEKELRESVKKLEYMLKLKMNK